MITACIHDDTQSYIRQRLLYVEQMLNQVLKKNCGKASGAEITTLEDLGLSNNLIRMKGGFFTGINVRWDSDIPFIPVDTTVNSCGVSIFKFDGYLDFNQFKERLIATKNRFKDIGIVDNFNRGNHFITLCEDINREQYLVIHASDNAYKYGKFGLYPREDTWFYNSIQTEFFKDGYIRFIIGDSADKFYNIYLDSEKSNPKRNKVVAELFLDGFSNIQEMLYSPHYGMPDRNSVSIGSQWRDQDFVMLTYPGANLFVLSENNPKIKYKPHGFGLKLNRSFSSIEFLNDGILLDGIKYRCDGAINSGLTINRNSDILVNTKSINDFMPDRTIEFISELRQKYAYTRRGITNYLS